MIINLRTIRQGIFVLTKHNVHKKKYSFFSVSYKKKEVIATAAAAVMLALS